MEITHVCQLINVVYPYNGILFGVKKEWNTDLCYNMDNNNENIMLSERSK
jgi:hypothetical protein